MLHVVQRGGAWAGCGPAQAPHCTKCNINTHQQLASVYYTRWAKLNGANAVSFVVVKHVLENFDNFWQVKEQFIYAL